MYFNWPLAKRFLGPIADCFLSALTRTRTTGVRQRREKTHFPYVHTLVRLEG